MRLLVTSTSDFAADVLVRALQSSGYQVECADFEPTDAVFALLDESPPDALIVSSSMAAPVGPRAAALAHRLRAGWPELAVIVMSDQINTRAAVELLGASPHRIALLLTTTMQDVDCLVDAIERATAGEAV